MNVPISYLVLAYISHTFGRALTDLVPAHSATLRRLLPAWGSTATGVALSYASNLNILDDLGISATNYPAIGYLITGVVLGHGVHYTVNFLQSRPWRPGPKH